MNAPIVPHESVIAAQEDAVATLQTLVDRFVQLDRFPRRVGEARNDLDSEALELSRAMLAPVAEKFRFVQANALKVPSRLREAGRFDLVLAGGLFDYLPERLAIALIAGIHDRMLGEGGTFFFTNIAAGNPYRVLVEYLGDWFLRERTEEQIFRYCEEAGIARTAVNITRDETGLALLVEVRKR